METTLLAQSLLLALTTAGLYAAIASGLTLEFGVTGIINFAHGEFVMLGAFLTYFLYEAAGVPPLAGMVLSGLAMTALSWLVFDGFLSRVLKQDEHNQILATIGLSILLINLAMIAWTPDARVMHAPALLPPLQLGDVIVPGNNLVVLLVGIALYAGMIWFMRHTRQGLLLRLAADDPQLAVLAGVDVTRMFRLSFLIGGLTAGVSGGLVALILYVQPLVGVDLVMRAFAIVALGGLGSIGGALIGAVLLSAAENLTATFVPGGGSWGYGVAFVIIVLVLVVRPTGLFGSERRA
ncbi:branched-chain amino acid ABC transporter permease [Azospirillum sp. A1-3]|uniref:branched-chain amino acid ABC transporter permease n=1 Tax=Azospirillum sp. A1-3 TaxID=185874 RepID=UPI0020772CB1|nr:branched-chain amino acid ABC transporter permease [Azospirillum sp. A1-3]MCM8735236.1 branched-chain amino acid ABC transporter permease [Azospirillum sp. A1-3]